MRSFKLFTQSKIMESVVSGSNDWLHVMNDPEFKYLGGVNDGKGQYSYVRLVDLSTKTEYHLKYDGTVRYFAKGNPKGFEYYIEDWVQPGVGLRSISESYQNFDIIEVIDPTDEEIGLNMAMGGGFTGLKLKDTLYTPKSGKPAFKEFGKSYISKDIRDTLNVDDTNKIKESLFHQVQADFFKTTPFASFDGRVYTKTLLKSFYIQYSQDKFKMTPIEADAAYQQFISNGMNGIIPKDLELPLKFVVDPLFQTSVDTVLSLSFGAGIIGKAAIKLTAQSRSDVASYSNIYSDAHAREMNLDTLMRLDVNKDAMTNRFENYLNILQSIMYYMSENIYSRSTEAHIRVWNLDTKLDPIIDGTSSIISDTEDGYRRVVQRFDLMNDLMRAGLISSSLESQKKFIESIFNSASLKRLTNKIHPETGKKMSVIDWLLYSPTDVANWQTLGEYLTNWAALSVLEKNTIKDVFFEGADRMSKNIWISLLQSSDIAYIKEFKDSTKLIMSVARFGRTLGKNTRHTYFPLHLALDRSSRSILGIVRTINSLAKKFNGKDLFPMSITPLGANKANRVSHLQVGSTMSIEEVTTLEKVITYFADYMFQGDLTQFNQFLAQSWETTVGQQVPLEMVQYVPFTDWSVTNLKADGYAKGDLKFFASLHGQPVFVQCDSVAEKAVILKLFELDAFGEIGVLKDAKHFSMLYNRKKGLLVTYTGVDGKTHHAEFDIAASFNGDGGRSVILEILGYPELNEWGDDYGLDKNSAAKKARDAMISGYALIYLNAIAESRNKLHDEMNDYYLTDAQIDTIGKSMPYLTREQFAFLIGGMISLKNKHPSIASTIGLEYTLGNLHTLYYIGTPNRILARNLQQAFGLKTGSAITFDSNGNIETTCITTDFHKWWSNFWKSDQKEIGGVDNPMYAQVHQTFP